MKTTDNRSLQSYRRVSNWKTNHDAILQTAPAAVQTFFTSLDGVINRIEVNAATQAAEHQNRTREATNADELRTAVKDAMRPISQVARTLRGKVFGISAIPLMPRNADNEHLVNAANSMAQNATIVKADLIAHGLQPDCIETLTTAAAALKSSIDARGIATGKAVAATKGIRTDVPEGRKLVSLIDAALSTLLKNDPTNLASWKNAKRVTLKGVQSTTVTLTPAGTTAPSTTPAASTAAMSTTPAAAAPAVTTTPTVTTVAAQVPHTA